MSRLHVTLLAGLVVTGLGLASACNSTEQAAGSDQMAMSHGQPAPAGAAKAPSVFDAPQAVGTPATCPVLGNTFTITADTLHSEHQGKHVYFCCAGCKPQFDADPQKYLK
ncbi:MAG: YHS domain-containing protein [Proteobacteria bacterium]|jgi:YHS domain-containing protein|nr:YHS domain-containing protein [Pseudomonadota bacterium]